MSSIWDPPRKPPPRAGTSRMFETDLLERLSRVHPAAPFVFWLPVLAVVGSVAFAHEGRGAIGVFAVAVSAGALGWSFVEYVLHRWVFHHREESARGRRLHFLLHGVHHEHPDDKDRLVMPLAVSVPVGAVVYALSVALLGREVGAPLFVGFALGYLAYDGAHYAIHHFKPRTAFGRLLKRHHMVHHHVEHDAAFGVSSPLWDHLFATMPKRAAPRARAPRR